jgi:hypothetical protein
MTAGFIIGVAVALLFVSFASWAGGQIVMLRGLNRKQADALAAVNTELTATARELQAYKHFVADALSRPLDVSLNQECVERIAVRAAHYCAHVEKDSVTDKAHLN